MPRSTPAERPAPAAGFLPHDLVELASLDAIVLDGPRPGWLRASLARAPFVVVRRSPRRGALLPVGVRGANRRERLAAWLPATGAARRVRPEELAARRGRRTRGAPQLAALPDVAALMAARGLLWGPVGAAGFELATGVPCVSAASDLDLVVRAPAPLDRDLARALHAALAALPVRVDLLLETPAGGVALAEYAAGSRVVLRTPEGPRWTVNPWAAPRIAP
jgi:phosphoribosyl-dephospho-CoA transferase